jgi:RND superfamily putative drug exporter
VITVIPTTAPQSEATEALVARLRHDVIPASGATAHVGGATASNVDFAQVLRDRLPLFIGGVLASSFVLLMVVFRSLLVPLKAVLLNLLSIGAAFGAMVVAFQWRDGAPIEPWAPMLLFAIVFGLSMDYEVFLLSAVKEHWDATGDNREAVVEGLSSTARVITGAAAIMVAVFGGFLTADLHAVRMIGFGLAFAVLVDATVVRMLLVPASMELLGNRNWWLPRFIGARLPQVQLEMSTR